MSVTKYRSDTIQNIDFNKFVDDFIDKLNFKFKEETPIYLYNGIIRIGAILLNQCANKEDWEASIKQLSDDILDCSHNYDQQIGNNNNEK